MSFLDKKLISNFSWLSALQIFNVLVPLLTYPYLIRVLGANTYGLIVFSQAIIAYFVIIINFGFSISATKNVSIHRDNKKILSIIVSSVFIIKGFLLLLSFLLLTIVVFIIPKAYENRWLLYLSMYACLYEFLFPVWFFQGIEKMKHIAYITLTSRVIFLFLIFFVVTDQSDYLWIPILNGIGAIVAGIVSIWFVFWHEKICFQWVPIEKLIVTFKESIFFFYSRIAGVISEKTTILMVGVFSGLTEVAFYDLAVKITALGKMPFSLVNQTVYPRIAKKKDMVLAKTVIKWSFLLAIFIFIFIFIFNEKIIIILGGEAMLPSYWVIVILSLTIPMSGVSYHLGNCVLVVMGKPEIFNKSVLYYMVVHLSILTILWLSDNMSILYISCSLVIAGLFDVLYRYYYARKFIL